MEKLVVVTGGTKGIGRAVIERFAREKYNIVTCSRNEDELRELQQKIEATYKVDFYFRTADMSQKEEVEAFGYFVKSIGQPVEVLVNNAGVFIPGTVLDEPQGNLEMMIDTNLYSAYYLTRMLAPAMKEARKGHIISMGSIAGITAYANGGSYAISKWAMLGFTKCIRQELKEFGVRVTSILPGATYTASWEGVELPVDRFMKPEDVAEVVWTAYHLSDRTVMEEVILRPQLGDI